MIREEFTTSPFVLRRLPMAVENPRLVVFTVDAVSNAVVPTSPVRVE